MKDLEKPSRLGTFTHSEMAIQVVNRDIDRPLLVLMGGKDTATPPAACTSKLDFFARALTP